MEESIILISNPNANIYFNISSTQARSQGERGRILPPPEIGKNKKSWGRKGKMKKKLACDVEKANFERLWRSKSPKFSPAALKNQKYFSADQKSSPFFWLRAWISLFSNIQTKNYALKFYLLLELEGSTREGVGYNQQADVRSWAAMLALFNEKFGIS